MTTKTLKRRDDKIRDHVLFELKSDPRITSSDIAAAVKDGVVTLSGFVTSYWEKDAAEKAAKRVYGVNARRQYWCRMAVSEDPRRVGGEEVERSDRHYQRYKGQAASFSARGKEPDRGSAASKRRA